MAEVRGFDIDDVVTQVKQAIYTAQRIDIGPAGPGVDVTQVDLTLKGTVQVSSGGEAKFKIPFIDLEFKFGGSVAEEQAQTLAISFTPAKPKPRPFEGAETTIKNQLVDTLVEIRKSLKTAAGGDVPLGLKSGTITLDFIFNDKGEVSLLVKGSLESKWSNQVKLTLGPQG